LFSTEEQARSSGGFDAREYIAYWTLIGSEYVALLAWCPTPADMLKGLKMYFASLTRPLSRVAFAINLAGVILWFFYNYQTNISSIFYPMLAAESMLFFASIDFIHTSPSGIKNTPLPQEPVEDWTWGQDVVLFWVTFVQCELGTTVFDNINDTSQTFFTVGSILSWCAHVLFVVSCLLCAVSVWESPMRPNAMVDVREREYPIELNPVGPEPSAPFPSPGGLMTSSPMDSVEEVMAL